MEINKIRSFDGKRENPSKNNSTSCFDYLRNCFKDSQRKEVLSGDSESQKASSLNDALTPSLDSSENHALQKRFDLGKFVIEHFTNEGRYHIKFEKINKHLAKVDEQKQEIIKELEDILSQGKEDIEKWKQAAENVKNQLEDYKPDIIKSYLNENFEEYLQKITLKGIAEEEVDNIWKEYDNMWDTIDKMPKTLDNLRQIPKTLDKLLNDLIPSQQQHLDKIKRGDSLNRYKGYKDLNPYTQDMIKSVEIQNPTVKQAYLISERYYYQKEQKSHLIEDNDDNDNHNLTVLVRISYYRSEINKILDLRSSSASQNEIIHNQDAGPSKPPEPQLDLLSKLTKISELPIYIGQLVQQYGKLGEATNKLERIEAAHDKYIKILNDKKEKLGKINMDKKNQ